MNRSIGEFKQASDSVSLAKLENQPFTITAVERSDYEDQGQIQKGVKITTKEKFKIDGKDYSKFHSTRHAIVNRLLDQNVLDALAKGDTIGPVRTEKVKAKKGGKDYFDLIPA